MVQGHPTNLGNPNNKAGLIEGLGGKLTSGTWVHRFLTIDDKCLMDPNLENILGMDVIGYHVTNKNTTIPKWTVINCSSHLK